MQLQAAHLTPAQTCRGCQVIIRVILGVILGLLMEKQMETTRAYIGIIGYISIGLTFSPMELASSGPQFFLESQFRKSLHKITYAKINDRISQYWACQGELGC